MINKKIGLILLFFFVACFKPAYHESRFIVLGTYLEVLSEDERAAEIVYREVKRLNAVFNKYDSCSEIYKVNNSPGKKVKVSPELIELVKKTKKYYQITNAAFDVSKGKLYSFWKEWIEGEGPEELPSQEKLEKIVNAASIFNIKIDSVEKIISLREGVKLDLSGVAKGYIVDKAVARLKDSGIKNALVNAGGDLYCLGKNKGRPWQVGIRSPAGEVVKTIEVVDRAVATSGNYHQFRRKNEKKQSHLIDPRTGYPVKQEFMGVTVVADQAWVADILATAFFINGKEFASKFTKDNPSVKAYFVTENELIEF